MQFMHTLHSLAAVFFHNFLAVTREFTPCNYQVTTGHTMRILQKKMLKIDCIIVITKQQSKAIYSQNSIRPKS